MKVFEYRIDKKKKKCGVTAMSLVESPAIETNFIALSKEEVPEIQLKINKEQRIVTGPAMIPDIKIYRSAQSLGIEEDGYIFFTAETIKKASELFMENEFQNNTTLEHDSKSTDIKLVESWIVLNKEKDKASELGFNVPNGTWMVSYKINNEEIWNKVKSGEFKGFSIEAQLMDRIEMSKEVELAGPKYEWVVGDNENHCPHCLEAQHYSAMTMAQWEASQFGTPGSGKTYCKDSCQCKLEPQSNMSIEPDLTEDEVCNIILEEITKLDIQKLKNILN